MRNIFLRGISILLAFTLIIGSAPVSVFATETVTDPTEAIIEQLNNQVEGGTEVTEMEEEPVAEYEYITNEEGNAVITKYNGSDVFVTVPETIDGISVVGIGGNAFVNNADILEVNIPEGIVSIESGAFSNCAELNSIVIPSSVTIIASDAFEESNNVKLLCYFDTAAYTYAQEMAVPYIRIYEGDDLGVSGTCTETLKWHLNLITGLFVIHGTGAMPNYTAAENGTPWYGYMSKMKSLKILDGITSIGASAFRDCYGIKGNLIIPDTVTSLGEGVFYNCYGFDGTLTLSNKITTIPGNAFALCKNFTGELVIPDSVTTIHNNAFSYYSSSSSYQSQMSKITSIVIGEKVTKIGTSDYYLYNPFYGMTGVKEITFKGTTVPSRGYADIFYSMNSLETVYVPSESYSAYVSAFSSYVNNGKIVASGSNEEFTISDGVLLLYQGEGGEVTIPAGVESIGQSAFQNCTTVTSVTFNEELKSVGSYAFSGCTNLASVTINKGLTNIGSYAFQNCKALTTVAFNSEITTIGAYAFSGCTGLAGDLTIPESVTSIGNYAFSGCTGLNGKLTIEGNAESTTIGQYAFNSCTKITVLELGDGITSIGNYAFNDCYGIKGNLVIPDTVTSLGEGVFYNCYGFDGTLTLSNKITTIPGNAFALCKNFTGELVIPDSVTTIHNNAFSYYSSSSSYQSQMSKITSIVIGEKVTKIGTSDYYLYNPFYGMTGVKEITFKGTTVPSRGYADIFYSMNSLETVYVPAESYEAYVNAFKSYINSATISYNSLDSKIKEFKAVGRYNNTIALSWSAHINENVVGYVVLRNGEKVTTTSVCHYTDTNLEPGTYTYSVYGITTAEEVTSTTTLTTSTAVPELLKIYTNHIQNSVGPTDGKIFITATNNNNFNDLEGNEIKGKLYYVVDGERIFIGESVLSQGSTATSQLVYTVNWDVTEIEAGEYSVVFTIEDIDGASAEIEGTINVDKSVPEKIINVVAVGEFTKINLSWSQSSEVDSNTYKIYRKSEVDTKWFLVKTITNRTTLTYVDSNVKEGRKYYYYVVTENSFGTQSEPSDVAVAMRATDVEAPTATKFTPSTNSYISKTQTITVTAVDNLVATSAKLYYSLDDGTTWNLVGEDTSAPFNFTFNTKEFDDGVITMQAFAYDAEGNESLPMTCKYSIDNTGPEKVTGLAAKAILTSKLTLEWKDVSDNDAACFILQQKTANGYTTIASTITTLGYNLSNLIPSTEYTYRVAAVDIHGNIGEYSDDFTVSTAVDTIPPVVTSLAPSPSRHNNSILFKATAGDDCAIQSIAIQVSTDRVNWETVSVANYSTYSKTATYAYNISLADYTDCSIFVRAIATDFSNNQSDTTDAAAFVEYIVDKTAPTSPRDLIASGGDGWVYISWLQGAEEDLNTYSIFRSTSEKSGYSLIASGLKKVSYYDTTAERDTVYYYKIRVTDTTGNTSDFSEVVSAKVADDITPPEVVNINPASGSFVGPAYKTVEALVKDNNCIKDIVIEYRINDETEFETLKEFKDVGYYYTTVRTDLPIGELSDGDKIYIRVYATDITGLTSEYSCEYTYVVDRVAPTISGLAVGIENDNCKITWSDVAGADVSGYKVYRINGDGSFTFLGSRSYSSSHSYTFYDFVYNLGEGDYAYKIEAYDKVGNSNSFFTDPVHYKHERENTAPVAVINGFEVMEVGVEEFFDAGSSKDDSAIVSYLWDFGDGTTSTEIKTVKKYSKPGTYTVTLTVTDDDEVSTTEEIEVIVSERTAVGTVRVNVVDENGSAVSGAPVYYDLGNEKQKIVYTDSNGVASLLMEKGDHPIGVYKSGYLPVQKNVTVLPNATRVVTMTIIEQEIVTGKFEVTRMTFSEIKAANIDVYSPENQNVYKVNVTLKYGNSEVPISYVRNDSKILSYEVKDFGGSSGSTSSGGGGGGGGKIGGITFIPNEKNAEIIAVLELPVKASYLKEFFDVKLHIVNNASPEFKLVDNDVYLNVPEGMTMMQGLTGDWNETPAVHIDSIVGQETKTLAWVLRGDKEGEYDLQADFDGTLAVFNEPVHASFKTDEPIKVYGLSAMKMVVEVSEEIECDAFYFNIGLENVSDIDIYNPCLDFNGIISNITATAKKLDDGIVSDEKEDYDVESYLLNVRLKNKDSSKQYIPYTVNSDGTISVDIDTLSPGDSIYYEYVAYNAIDSNGIAYFNDAATEVLEGYSSNVEVVALPIGSYSMQDYHEKFVRNINLMSDSDSSISYILDDSNFMYVSNSGIFDRILEGGYNGLKLITLDLGVLTKDEQKKVVQEIVLELLTDEAFYENIEDSINTQYIKAVKSVLGIFKNEVTMSGSKYDPDSANLIAVGINNILGNDKELRSLADSLEILGPEGLQSRIIAQLVAGGLSGAMLEMTREILAEKCAEKTLDSAMMKGLSDGAKYAQYAVEFLIENPIEAYNSTERAEYIHGILNLYAYNEYANLIMDTIISSYSETNRTVDSVISMVGYAIPPLKIIQSLDTDIQKIVASTVEEMKTQVGKNFSKTKTYFSELAKETAISAGKIAMKEALKKILGKANIWYTLLSGIINLADRAMGWGEHFETQDAYNIATYITSALVVGFNQRVSLYNSPSLITTYNGLSAKDYTGEYQDELAKDAMYLLKGICKMRITGENIFRKFYESDNSNIFQDDAEYDERLLSAVNKKFGKSFTTSDEVFDYIYSEIMTARDGIFNIHNQTDIVKPAAPLVTFNYDTMSTNEKFDLTYEYCMADGVWIDCSGESISVNPKTNTTVLRVRKSAQYGTVSGEITTVTIHAKRELSKTISAKYDSGKYYFTNLLDFYTYEVCPLDSSNESPDWSKSFTVKGGTGASASGKQGKYLAIRTLANEELRETVSQTLVIPVATKQPLVIDTWGNGSVTQSSKSGTYFIGDNVTLTSKADEGAAFRGWYIGNELVSKDSEYILEMYPYAEIVAKFEGGTATQAESIGLTLMTEDETYDVQPISTMSLRRFARTSNSVSVYAGTTAKLYAGVYPVNATDKAVTWTSSDDTIATVDANGTISFLAEGTVIITATLSNSVSASFEIVVLENIVEDFYIATPVEKTTYYEDENLDLTGLKVLARYSDGNIIEITNYTVSGYEATCGEKTITVSYEGKTVQFNVEVVHNTDWTVSKEATCSEEGVRTKYCIICGEVLETQQISKIAHKTVWQTTKEATPEEKGIKELVCSVCGTSTEQKEVDYCEHSFKKDTVEPDCVNKGYTEYICTKCEEVKISDYVDALGHNYTEKVVVPSCGKTGYTIYTCSLCDDKYADNKTDALEHNYAEQTVDPTCTSHGCVLHTCSICGASYETDIVKKVPHSYELTVTEPTCDAGGYTTYTCKTCDNSYVADEVNPVGHSYKDTVISGNCEEGKYILHECTVCGHSYKTEDTAATGHTYGEWLVRTPADEGHAGIKYRTCIYCNHEETAAIPVTDHTHTVGEWYVEKEATCADYGIKAQKCDQCGEIVTTEAIEAEGHNYTSVDTKVTCTQNGYTTNTCSKCGDVYQSDVVVAPGHTESDWITDVEVTCTTDGKRSKHCTVCNETTAEEAVESTGHINCVWIVIEEATCTVIGSRESKCLACGEIVDEEIVKPLGHKYSTVTTEANCTENGFTSYTCSVCSDHYDSDVVEANGHVEGEWEVMTEPTTTSEGLKVKCCTECGRILKQESIPSLRIPVESIVLNKTTAEILCEQQLQLSATITPDVATNKNVKWQSTNENVATVDSNGLITAVSVGKATITATAEDNGICASCEITVKSNMFTVAWVVDGKTTEQSVKFGDSIAKPDEPIVIGYKFVGWTPEVPATMPAYDLSFTAILEANVYDATFNANGGKWPDGSSEKLVATKYGATIVVPEAPVKQGFLFAGWSTDVGIMDDINGKTFTAVWTASTDTIYTVETYTMNTSGEYEKSSQVFSGTTGETATAENTVPSGFSLNAEKSILSGTISADNSLVLKVYLDRNIYTFTTVVDGVSSEAKYLYGSIVSEPIAPTKAGYKFIKWDGIVPETMPAENVTVTAVFEKYYACPDCGEEILGEDAISKHIASETKVTISDGVVVTSGELKPGATITLSAPQVDGKIFSHWTVNGATVENSESSNTTIVLSSGKITITAEYEDCECKCHQGGIAGFFFKIVLFFQKLFGNNLECFCGKKH